MPGKFGARQCCHLHYSYGGALLVRNRKGCARATDHNFLAAAFLNHNRVAAAASWCSCRRRTHSLFLRPSMLSAPLEVGILLFVRCSIATALVVRNASGGVIVEFPPGNAFRMPFGFPLKGTYNVRVHRDPCSTDAWSDLSGFVVLGGGFDTGGCSREHRTRLGQAANATGIVFAASLHTPFDWDGSTWSELSTVGTAALWTGDASYAEVSEAIEHRGGVSLTIDATPTTPLLDLDFAIMQWVLCALLLTFIAGIAVHGMYKTFAMTIHGESGTPRKVVTIETLSVVCMLVRSLAGPGYDLTHQLMYPNLVYRVFESLWADLHLIAMLLISKQLWHNMNLLERRATQPCSSPDQSRTRRSSSLDSLMSRLSSTVSKQGFKRSWQHVSLSIAVVIFIVIDTAFLLDFIIRSSLSEKSHDLTEEQMQYLSIHASLNIVAMGLYYMQQARRIQSKLKLAQNFHHGGTRVKKFSQNVSRVGACLVTSFVFMALFFVVYMVLSPQDKRFYIITTILSTMFFFMQAAAALFIMLSYQLPMRSSQVNNRISRRPCAPKSSKMVGASETASLPNMESTKDKSSQARKTTSTTDPGPQKQVHNGCSFLRPPAPEPTASQSVRNHALGAELSHPEERPGAPSLLKTSVLRASKLIATIMLPPSMLDVNDASVSPLGSNEPSPTTRRPSNGQ